MVCSYREKRNVISLDESRDFYISFDASNIHSIQDKVGKWYLKCLERMPWIFYNRTFAYFMFIFFSAVEKIFIASDEIYCISEEREFHKKCAKDWKENLPQLTEDDIKEIFRCHGIVFYREYTEHFFGTFFGYLLMYIIYPVLAAEYCNHITWCVWKFLFDFSKNTRVLLKNVFKHKIDDEELVFTF